MTEIVPILLMAPISRGARPLLAWRRLAAIGAIGTTTAPEMLMGELVDQAIGRVVVPLLVRLQIPLLPLVLSLLVRVPHEVAIAVVLLLLCSPHLLLALLVGVDGLRESRRSGGECPAAGVLVVLIPVAAAAAAAEAKVELQAVALLLLLLLVVVHGGRGKGSSGTRFRVR